MEISIFIIAITAIIFGTVMIASIVWSFFKYVGAKSQPSHVDSSLTTSELHGLIRDAVIEVTEPLNERIAGLEQHLEAQQQLPPARSDVLAGTKGYAIEVPDAPERQRVR